MLSILFTDECIHGFSCEPDTLDRAVQAARRAVDLGSANHKAWQALAWAQFVRKEFRASRVAAERAISLNPMDASAAGHLGQIIAYSGDWERGCELIAHAVKLNPNHPGWFWYAPFLNAYRKSDYRGALDFACKMNMPGVPLVFVALAASHGQLGQLDPAHAALRELLALKPDYAQIARTELSKLCDPPLVGQIVDGLRKAGLEIADGVKPEPVRPATQSGANLPAATPSIAVLPFANLSVEKDQEYFSDGLAEEIINLLAQISGLKVIARTSAFAFRGKEEDIRGIADALGVTTILQGSVRRAGSRIRVTVQLINAADSAHIWSERYDREMNDIFAVQDEIAAAIAEHLKVHFIGGKRQTADIAAYEAFLEGRHHWLRFSPEGITRAFECYQKSIALDPGYAPAHVGISEYYMASAVLGLAEPAECIPKMESAARRALELDDTLADAYGMLAHVSAFTYRWDEAKRYFLRALELSSGSAHTSHPYTVWYLLPQGLLEEALAITDKALARDPLNAVNRYSKSRVLSSLGRNDEALEWSRRAVDINPNYFSAVIQLTETLVAVRDFEQAIAIAEQLIQASGKGPWTLFALGCVHAQGGHVDEAHHVLEELSRLDPERSVIPTFIATLHAQLAESDAAFEWTDKAVEQRDPVLLLYIPFWKTVKACESVYSDPRYAALLKKMNL